MSIKINATPLIKEIGAKSLSNETLDVGINHLNNEINNLTSNITYWTDKYYICATDELHDEIIKKQVLVKTLYECRNHLKRLKNENN